MVKESVDKRATSMIIDYVLHTTKASEKLNLKVKVGLMLGNICLEMSSAWMNIFSLTMRRKRLATGEMGIFPTGGGIVCYLSRTII
jgi:hypothetical protein